MQTMESGPAAPRASGSRGDGGELRVLPAPGGEWETAATAGERYSVAGPTGRRRLAVRAGDGTEVASVGERVRSLVEHHTLWRGGRPFARVYRPVVRARPERWLVEAGDDALVARVDVDGLVLLRHGRTVAAGVRRDGTVRVEPGEDVGLVLGLVALFWRLEGEAR